MRKDSQEVPDTDACGCIVLLERRAACMQESLEHIEHIDICPCFNYKRQVIGKHPLDAGEHNIETMLLSNEN